MWCMRKEMACPRKEGYWHSIPTVVLRGWRGSPQAVVQTWALSLAIRLIVDQWLYISEANFSYLETQG